jgi:V8-like Glu-specific endopeptidase
MSTYHGDTGAPVFYQPPARHFWRIVAVHVTGVPSTLGTANGRNFGAALTEDVIAHIQEMLRVVDS